MKRVHVAAGVIRNTRREIFITKRTPGSHMAGFWEFPGGKIERNETAVMALQRELLEETGIVVHQPLPLSVLKHHFVDKPDQIVVLHFYLVETWEGEPSGREGQHGRWVAQHALMVNDFPPANASVIKLLTDKF